MIVYGVLSTSYCWPPIITLVHSGLATWNNKITREASTSTSTRLMLYTGGKEWRFIVFIQTINNSV